MPKKMTCQNLSDQQIELIAVRFRARGEVSRLKLIVALREGSRNVSQLAADQRRTTHGRFDDNAEFAGPFRG